MVRVYSIKISRLVVLMALNVTKHRMLVAMKRYTVCCSKNKDVIHRERSMPTPDVVLNSNIK